MDNHIFRSAIGGFHRQDVMEYIERTQKQSEENTAWLESQVEQLQKSEERPPGVPAGAGPAGRGAEGDDLQI